MTKGIILKSDNSIIKIFCKLFLNISSEYGTVKVSLDEKDSKKMCNVDSKYSNEKKYLSDQDELVVVVKKV